MLKQSNQDLIERYPDANDNYLGFEFNAGLDFLGRMTSALKERNLPAYPNARMFADAATGDIRYVEGGRIGNSTGVRMSQIEEQEKFNEKIENIMGTLE